MKKEKEKENKKAKKQDIVGRVAYAILKVTFQLSDKSG
jgi:hypothetical protein